eukprot:TRINITY_DN111962_c0_g1_i1.p1 TRINITY_DN111962_c0_g1~~TRINITY_DN111962_c0_g1_i1.p1  ORF type:complete len:287 (-),score=42.44 TRINITY_DN111962_c0_g1_i1:57-917(-)
MMLPCLPALLVLLPTLTCGRIVLVTGATGATGSLTYRGLRENGATVRGLVRNQTKAREVLGCERCDDSEGIFVGDSRNQSSMSAAMAGAEILIITTGPKYHCKIPSLFIGCHFMTGADPKTMAWESVKAQVAAFASSPGPASGARHVILLSNDLTTVPNNFLDKIDDSQGCFYALNGEAFLMSSGVQFTIIKPNALDDGPASTKEILVGHDDEGWSASNLNTEFISRADVARMLVFAALHPDEVKGLRFDVTSKRFGGQPTKDIHAVFDSARYPWNRLGAQTDIIV